MRGQPSVIVLPEQRRRAARQSSAAPFRLKRSCSLAAPPERVSSRLANRRTWGISGEFRPSSRLFPNAWKGGSLSR